MDDFETDNSLRHLLFLVFAIATLTFWGPFANAQGLSSLVPSATTSTEEDTSDVTEIIRSAAENGVSIIVIDSDGNILSQGNEAASENADDEQFADGSELMKMSDSAAEFRSALVAQFLALPSAFNEVVYILRAASPDGTIMAYFIALVSSLLLFGVGMLFERYIFGQRIARQYVVARIQENPQGYVGKMPFLVFRFFMGVTGTLVSMAVAYILGYIIFGPLDDSALQFTVALINIGYFSIRVVTGLWRMILSPFLAQYRIPLFSDQDAKKLYSWLVAATVIGASAILLGLWIGELGLNYDVYAFFSSLLSFVVMMTNIALVTANRKAITNALRNGQPHKECSWPVRFMANVWAPFAYLYLIFAWVELTYEVVIGQPSNIPMIAGAYGILTTIIVVYGIISYFIEASFARRRALAARNEELVLDNFDLEEAEIEVALQPRITTYEELAQRVAGVLAFVAGVYACLLIWDPPSTGMGESFQQRIIDITVICFLGYIAYYVFRIWIDQKIEEEQGDAPEEGELGDEGGGSSASRLGTLLPLFRNTVLVVIFVAIGLIVLMEMGVNVGPLFAGAGIVGVAIGFGSQALVRDIFSGAFFLFDDAFRKGEYVDVGGVKGTVEKISVRSFQLRHHLGALQTIPFGEIQVMTNYSRDWVIMKLPLRVTYDTDVEHVRKLIKNLGQELLDDPVIGQDFIQPLKSQGVIEMQDSAMIIRVKFMTKPGDQWIIRKRVYQEIRSLFDREGIKFAHREVTVRLAEDKQKELPPEQREAVLAAAQAAIDEDYLDEMAGGGDDR